MWYKIIKTKNDWAPLVLRALLAVVIFAHGAQKLLGWFGGYGFTGTMDYFTEAMGLPWLVAFSVIVGESLGALALAAGIGTRILGLYFTALALGIVISTHLPNGFFMNWYGNQPGEGYEYFILWIAISISLIFLGGGRFSIDSMISGQVKSG